jgi:hypothetical protein
MGYFRVIDIKKVNGIDTEIERFRFKSYEQMQKESKEHNEIGFLNHFVNAGKQFCMDFMFNSVSWLTGAAWIGPRYAGAGKSSDTNAGVSGPITGYNQSKALDGDWQGVSNNDWKLSSEVTTNRPQIITLRAGNTVYLRMKFTDDDFNNTVQGDNAVLGDHSLCEFGIFLSGLIGKPSADPTESSSAANRNNAMIIRGVSHYNDGTGYRSKEIIKKLNETLYVDYIFGDFEG